MCDVIKFCQGIGGEGADLAHGLRVILCGQLRPSMTEYGDNVRQYLSDGEHIWNAKQNVTRNGTALRCAALHCYLGGLCVVKDSQITSLVLHSSQ